MRKLRRTPTALLSAGAVLLASAGIAVAPLKRGYAFSQSQNTNAAGQPTGVNGSQVTVSVVPAASPRSCST